MPEPQVNERRIEAEVDAAFPDRWSPRAFDPEPLHPDQVDALFEAARWAPSCYNEQPWRFVYATSDEARARLVQTLVEKNQQWARHAPLLCYVLARTTFTQTGKTNRHAPFDAGAAWMALALQARRLGLYAHAMAGFRRQAAYDLLGVDPEAWDLRCAVAVGRRGDPASLPDDLLEMERPNERKPLSEVATPLGA